MAELFIGDRMTTSSSSSKIDISSATVTLVSNSFVYDGSVKTQAVQSVVLNGQTLVEGTDYIVTNYFKINAGTYTLAVRGIGNYEGVTTADWNIAKAQGSISVSPSSLAIIVNNSDTSTITYTGDGEITLSNSNTTAVTATRSGDTITVTANAEGSATITVTLTAGQNYTGGSATISATVSSINPTLSDNTPEQIQSAAHAGIASTLWSVGDKTANISIESFSDISATTNIAAFIIGFDHNSSKEGTNRIHFQFGKIGTIDVAFRSLAMNSSNTNSDGWNGSNMRTTHCHAFSTALPSAWQSVIASTTKYTDNTGNASTTSSAITSTSDNIFLLSEYEVFGTRTYANSYEQNSQAQYQYYINGNSKVKYQHNATSTASNWWLRSPCEGYSNSFCYVKNDGSAGGTGASWGFGFAPGFSIA